MTAAAATVHADGDSPEANLALARAIVEHLRVRGIGDPDHVIAAARRARILGADPRQTRYWEARAQEAAGYSGKAARLDAKMEHVTAAAAARTPYPRGHRIEWNVRAFAIATSPPAGDIPVGAVVYAPNDPDRAVAAAPRETRCCEAQFGRRGTAASFDADADIEETA